MTSAGKIEIGPRESKVLSVLQDSALLSVSDIAKLLSIRPHVARRFLDRLRESRIIVPYTPINTAALGYTECQFVLSGFPLTARKSLDFINRLVAHERICFIRELATELSFSFWVKELYEVQGITNELFSRLPHVYNKEFSVINSFRGFGLSFSSDIKPSGYVLQRPSEPVEIDSEDHRILRCISEKNRFSAAEISKATGIAASTVEYRRNRLIKSGVLLEPRFAISEHAVEAQSFTIRIKTSNISLIRDQFRKNAQTLPFVVILVELVGPWDFEVTICCKTSTELNDHIDRLLTGIARSLVTVAVQPSVKVHKIHNYPFR